MRPQLFYNPRLLCERLALESTRRRRLSHIKGTPAEWLSLGHIDILELIALACRVPISVVYDIGANVGTSTLLIKAVIPSAEIHAFEPLTEHQQPFIANTQGLDSVFLHRVALGPVNGHAMLHVTDFTDQSSILALSEPAQAKYGMRETGERPVTVVRLDDHVIEHNLPPPDLLKLDVQGYELAVLEGASRCLGQAKAVIAEVSFVEFYQGQCYFEDVVGVMRTHGFRLNALGANTAVGEPLLQTDALFLRVGPAPSAQNQKVR